MVQNPSKCIGNPSEILKDWIQSHSKILTDPWPEVSSSEPERSDALNTQTGVIIDPTFDREEEEESEWSGKYDKDYNIVGHGTLSLYDEDYFRGFYVDGIRDGWGLVVSKVENISSLTGNWEKGLLQGKIRMVSPDTSVLEGWCTNSKLNGPARKIIVKKFRTFRQQVSWFGRYKEGVPHGQCWEWCEGGGWLTGKVDSAGKFTGQDIAFVYPDMLTCLVGTFKDGVMISAVPGQVDSVTLENDIPVPTFKKKAGGTEVWYKISTKTDAGDNLLVPDPYEERNCQVAKSEVEDGDEGLYALRDIQEGEVVAFYNGVRLPYRSGEKEVWETSGYKIFVNSDYIYGERIDLPGDMCYLENYAATVGHKMNHSFIPNCTEWFFQHPRHGIIPCVTAIHKINKGEEFFLHYGYDPLNCPSWYRPLLDEFLVKNPDLDLAQAADPYRWEKEKVPWYKETLAI